MPDFGARLALHLKAAFAKLSPVIDVDLHGSGTGPNERSQAEKVLQRTRDRLLLAQRIGKMGSWELDIATGTLWWSDEIYGIFDCSPDAFARSYEGFASYIHPDDLARFQAAQDRALSGGQSLDIEHRIVTATGEVRWVHEAGELVPGADGRPAQLAGIVQDITVRKNADTRLNLLQSAVSRLNDMVVITEAEPIDEPGPRIVFVNEAFERRTGYSRDDVIGRSPKLLQGPRTQRPELDRIRGRLEAWQPVRAELINYTKAGEAFWLELDIAPITDANGRVTHWAAIERDVTFRKQVEEERDRLFNLSMDLLAVGNFDGFLEQVNPAWSQCLGWSAEELQGRPWLDFIHPDDRPAAITAAERLTQGVRLENFQNRYLCKDGSCRWLSWNTYPLLETRQLFAVARDITRQKLAEVALADSQRARALLSRCNEALIRSANEAELLSTVCQIAVEVGSFRLAWIGYARNDEDKLVVPQAHAGVDNGYLSGARITWSAVEPAGRGPAGAVIRTGNAMIVPDLEADADFAPWLEKALMHGFRGVVCLPLKDEGRTFGVLVLYMPEVRTPQPEERMLLDELAANLAYGIATLRSKEERERIEAAVLQVATSVTSVSSEYFFVELARSMTLATGAQAGFVARILPGEPLTARTIAAVADGQVIDNFDYVLEGTPCDALVSTDQCVVSSRAAEQFPGASCFRKMEPQGYAGRRLVDSGGRLAGVLFVLFREPLRQPGLASSTLQILAARAGAELERQASDERLRQSQRLESVGQLTGGVAHDFNNLLTVILGNAEVLSEHLADHEHLAPLAAMVVTAAERGAELTQRLLAFARKQALEPRPIDANALIANMELLLRRTLGEQIEIEFIRAAGLWNALVDATQLDSALLNLCLNARDAMPEGGRLTIETANAHLSQDYASQHPDVKPGQYVMLAVSDSGVGIASEHQGRVFEPFFTTKETGKGTGLGLAMVYGFVKQSGGHVSLYSEPGHGTTVRLYIPRATDKVQQIHKTEARAVGGAETILLVEDNEMVRRHAHDLLATLGYRVIEVSSGAGAMDVIRSTVPVDLLFTDVVMPGMSGRQLADEARKMRQGLKVLFTSGYTENAIVHHGRLDPGIHLLSKPYRREELALRIREALSA